jgi:hypothetical protein
MKHTPGPWSPYEGDKVFVTSTDEPICDIRGFGWLTRKYGEQKAIEIQKANAALIAAAPDLLQACISAMEVGEIKFESCVLSKDVKNKLQQAIKSATE